MHDESIPSIQEKGILNSSKCFLGDLAASNNEYNPTNLSTIAIIIAAIIIFSSHYFINNGKKINQKKGRKEYDPKNTFVQAIPQPDLKYKYQPFSCN